MGLTNFLIESRLSEKKIAKTTSFNFEMKKRKSVKGYGKLNQIEIIGNHFKEIMH